MQEFQIFKKNILIILFLISIILPSIVFSKDNAPAVVDILQDKKSFDITITTIDDAYILEDTLDISIIGNSASLNSIFFQDSESFDKYDVFWNKTKIRIVVDSKVDEKFKIQTTYQVCNNLHVCSKLQNYEKSFKISKPKEVENIDPILVDDIEAAALLNNQSSKADEVDLCAKEDICAKVDELAQAYNEKIFSNIPTDIQNDQELVSEQDTIVNMLKNDNLMLTLMTFFGFGLLLAFTPCMLPVIPILSAVIISKKERISTKEGFLLSLTYVISMSIVYAIAGIMAASLGSNIQAFFQQTWIIIIFSAFFFILSLAMFGTFSIEMPKKVQSFINSKATYGKNRTYLHVAFLGILSALIVGPCVAPPLAGALIYIGQTGDQLTGGLSLFLMSLGMGVPLLLLGAGAGKFIPKPGPWMDDVKLFFGFTMIGFSIWILSRILDPQIVLLMWGVLLAAIAIFMNIFENKACASIDSIYHLKKLIALLILMYGMILIFGAIAGATNVKDPLEPFRATVIHSSREVPSRVIFETITSDQLDSVVEQSSKPVMAIFTAKWCINCKELEQNVFNQSDVAQELEEFQRFKVDITENTDADRAMLKKYSLFGPPGTIFFDLNKRELKDYRLSGAKSKEIFIEHIKKVKRAF